MNAFIYSLNCPITNIPKYIGQTITNPQRRFNCHLQDKEHTPKANWIRKLKENNQKPILEIIDIVREDEISFWECHYISLFKSWGFKLKNCSSGGERPTVSLMTKKK